MLVGAFLVACRVTLPFAVSLVGSGEGSGGPPVVHRYLRVGSKGSAARFFSMVPGGRHELNHKKFYST